MQMARRQFTRPAPGNRYSAAERAEWGRQQDIARAQRNAAQSLQKEIDSLAPKTKAKHASRSKPLIADVSGSTCFNSLVYQDGVVTASFIGPSSGEWTYEMSRSEAKEWFSDNSLGSYFNAFVREAPVKGN